MSLITPAAGAEVDRRRIAVLLLCYNEEATIGAVIDDARASCPATEAWRSSFRSSTLLRAYKPLTTFGGLSLHTLNFRVKELHSVITRRRGSSARVVGSTFP
jgi:hypothetical protein